MGNGIEQIHDKIQSFKKRYYLNLFIRGIILTLTVVLLYFLLATVLEYAFWLGSVGRFFILALFFCLVCYCYFRFLKDPFSFWVTRKGLGDEQSARLIGNKLPGINDRLVNVLQLSDNSQKSSLAYASVQQKTKEFEPIRFEAVVDLNENRKYIKYLIIPLAFILALMIINEGIFTQSTHRIVHFNQQFSPEAPFKFTVESSLNAFFNEDFTLNVSLSGDAIPETAYLTIGSQRLKMEGSGNGSFTYVFEKLQENKTFQIEAAGFYSTSYEISLIHRPELSQIKTTLEYPAYLNRKSDLIVNAGNLEVPEGTIITWSIKTANAEKASILFKDDASTNPMQLSDSQIFTYKKSLKNPDQYEISLLNNESENKERIAYQIDVIKDQYPQIVVNNFKDSILYKHVMLGGSVADDYGVTQLALEFHVRDDHNNEIASKRINIPITRGQLQQSYFYNWSLDSIKLKPGEQLEYFLQVWDNDGVNGRKSTRSAMYNLLVPSKDQLVTDIGKTQSNTEQKIEQGVNKAQDLQNKIEDAYQKMKGKQNLDWQDKKKLEEILDQKKNLDQFINELKEQNRMLEQKKNTFTEQDERIKEKAEQIQKLMDELLDDETKKLLEELEKLLKENSDTQQLQNLMNKLNQDSKNLEKELERTLELFKQLQLEYKMDQSIQELKEQVTNQQELLKKTEELEKQLNDSSNKKNAKNQESKGKNDEKGNKSQSDSSNENDEKSESQKLGDEQKELNDEFKKTSEKLEELKELSEELNQSGDFPEEKEMQEIDQSQQESEENLNQNSPSKSKESQKQAIQQMQKMQQKLESMQGSMEMEMDMQNIESLRQILHGLIKLSFDQENLMKQFNEIQQNDPRFNTLAQQQLKLKDDAKVLEDSLLELGKRDEMLSSFVSREVTELNNHIENAVEANKERRRQQAATEMQYSMTSINNLALMLDSHFDMLMQMMANAKPSMGKGKKKGQPENLSQLQQQLNQRIEQLKNSGKSGRQLSEELAEMAAEQERIRRALKEMQDKMKENGGHVPGDDLPGKMEQTETELVNKQLTEQLIKRQKEILTRLLEAEKSMREQNLDEERKGETAKDYEKEMPKAIEEYLRLKEKEVELLKTVPPKLYPFYKKEVNEYFKRIGEN